MNMKNNKLYPDLTKEISEKRTALAPEISEAWRSFSKTVFKQGALSEKTKQLIAIAVAHVTQCPYCIHGHTAQAMRKGASEQEIMEAIWVAAEMRAGGSYVHSALAIDEMESKEKAI